METRSAPGVESDIEGGVARDYKSLCGMQCRGSCKLKTRTTARVIGPVLLGLALMQSLARGQERYVALLASKPFTSRAIWRTPRWNVYHQEYQHGFGATLKSKWDSCLREFNPKAATLRLEWSQERSDVVSL